MTLTVSAKPAVTSSFWAAALRLSWASPRRFASPLQHDQVVLAATVLADMAVHVLNAHRDLVTD